MGLSQELTLGSRQQLAMTAQLQQSLHVLQLPIEELEAWLSKEIEANPVMQERGYRRSGSCHQEVFSVEHRPYEPSIYEQLHQQLSFSFPNSYEYQIAEQMIGNLSERGLLEGDVEQMFPGVEISVVEGVRKRLFELEPSGVGCQSVQEFLLWQLKEGEIAYRLIKEGFSLLASGKWKELAALAQISVAEVKRVVAERIAVLRIYPVQDNRALGGCERIPDVIFSCHEGSWSIEVNQSSLPQWTVSHPMERSSLSSEESAYFKEKRRVAAGIKYACEQRQKTLYKISRCLLKKQRAFFEGIDRGALVPLTMRQVAEEMGLHESTVARAVKGKTLSSPLGIFSMSDFFKQGVGEISNHSVKQLLKHLVDREDKRAPLSDLALLKQLQARGVVCARRTVAKYRESLGIVTARERML